MGATELREEYVRVLDLSCDVMFTCVQVWKPHVASSYQSVLIVDVHRGHLTDEFRTSLTSLSTDVFFIPSGCCCRLQPLDVCVTPVLRDFLQVVSPVSLLWICLTALDLSHLCDIMLMC